jgi:hypothetical protein
MEVSSMIKYVKGGMSWDVVQLDECDAISAYIISRLGAGPSKSKKRHKKRCKHTFYPPNQGKPYFATKTPPETD